MNSAVDSFQNFSDRDSQHVWFQFPRDKKPVRQISVDERRTIYKRSEIPNSTSPPNNDLDRQAPSEYPPDWSQQVPGASRLREVRYFAFFDPSIFTLIAVRVLYRIWGELIFYVFVGANSFALGTSECLTVKATCTATIVYS